MDETITKLEGEDAVIIVSKQQTPDGKIRFMSRVVTRDMIEEINKKNNELLAILDE